MSLDRAHSPLRIGGSSKNDGRLAFGRSDESVRKPCAYTHAELYKTPLVAMMKILFRTAWAVFLMASLPLQAHEFWIAPVAAPLSTGDTARLTLQVGEFFEGDLIGFSAAQTVALRQYSAAGNKDLRALLPGGVALPALPLRLDTPGAHLLVFDSQPNQIELSADKFHAYLHDEGLDFIKARREAAGTAAKPGRERYRRHVKTLLRVGSAPHAVPPSKSDAADMTYATRAGQRLEIVPMADPLRLSPGDVLGVQAWFDNKPLAGALVKAWHKRDGQTLIIRATTSAEGKAAFNLPYAGAWMVSVVHMIPVTGVKDIDWDSLWSNLTFVMPPVAKVTGDRP